MDDPQALADLLAEDTDDDFNYEEVEVLSEEEENDDVSEDLDAALRSLKAFTSKTEPAATTPMTEAQPGQVTRKPEVMDDFLRNFFVKMGLARTCETFEAEWYELKATGRLEGNQLVPDIYQRNAHLEEEVAALRRELDNAKLIASKASATWDKFRKERDFHRMHHKRVAQEKNKLVGDMKRLKDHYAKYEPTILELKRKYELAMKEKMLMSIEKDKVAAKIDALGSQVHTTSIGGTVTTSPQAHSRSFDSPKSNGINFGINSSAKSPNTANLAAQQQQKASPNAQRSGWVSIMGPQKRNPYEDLEFPPAGFKGYSLQKTFKGHLLSVANIAIHPTKPILVTASDDKTWKMWHMPAGDLIMCGEGHKDWVAGVDFHPSGIALATGSGDNTVKIWDFEKQRCTLTLSDHKQAVWGVKYHHGGEVLASCSLDHTVRLWDLPAAKCRIALRGHVDSVNDIAWQPFTSNLATASSDKTVSVWDARSGLCTQTFYGHQNSCNAVAFNLLGTMLASTDADGVVKLWDTRMVAEILTAEVSKQPVNKCAIDRSGQVLAVACDDGLVHGLSTANGENMGELSSHDDAVQALAFDPAGEYLVSCGSDNTFRLWA